MTNNLVKPRSIAFDTEGSLVVVEKRKGIPSINLEVGGGSCVTAISKKTAIGDTKVDYHAMTDDGSLAKLCKLNHGLALSHDGRSIYASSSATAFSWSYNSLAGTATNKTSLVNGMDNPDHNTRTFLASQFIDQTLIISRGSNDNIDPGAAVLSSGRSQIRAFDLRNIPPSGYDFGSIGRRLGRGLRNSVGVAEHPVTGGLYPVENSVDNMLRDGKDVHQDDPGEEMNFHGTLTNSRYAGQRGNYGYPDCFAAHNVAALPNNSNFRIGTHFTNSSALDYLCKSTMSPRLTFPANMAPLDIKFDQNEREAWVSFHGSW